MLNISHRYMTEHSVTPPNNSNGEGYGFPAMPFVTTSSSPHAHNESVWAYALVPLGAIMFLGLLIFLIVVILKKNRLDKLRHHLMPLYNFDPADEDRDWECELLEEDKEQQIALRSESPSFRREPKLKFTTEHTEL